MHKLLYKCKIVYALDLSGCARPADELGEVVEDGPGGARHLAQVARLLPGPGVREGEREEP